MIMEEWRRDRRRRERRRGRGEKGSSGDGEEGGWERRRGVMIGVLTWYFYRGEVNSIWTWGLVVH